MIRSEATGQGSAAGFAPRSCRMPSRARKQARPAPAHAARWPLGWAVAACTLLTLALQRLLWPRPRYPHAVTRRATSSLAEELEAAAAAGVPVVFTGVESLPAWAPADIAALQLTRVYEQQSPVFGPYYDGKRPLARVGRVRPRHNYTEASMRGGDFFGGQAPPWRYYSGEVERDLSAGLLEQLRPLERGLVTLTRTRTLTLPRPLPLPLTRTRTVTVTATLARTLGGAPAVALLGQPVAGQGGRRGAVPLRRLPQRLRPAAWAQAAAGRQPQPQPQP
jgi:hypothetical protein